MTPNRSEPQVNKGRILEAVRHEATMNPALAELIRTARQSDYEAMSFDLDTARAATEQMAHEGQPA